MKYCLVIFWFLAALAYGQATEDNIEFITDSGLVIQAKRMDVTEVFALPKPETLTYFIEPDQTIKLWGEYIYIDEAALYANNIMMVINPWEDVRSPRFGSDVLAFHPYDFIDASWSGLMVGLPATSAFQYLEITHKDWSKEKETSEFIDPWQCSSAHHDTTPHPTNSDPDAPCHAKLGASGNCERSGQNGATAQILCSTRLNAQGQIEENCVAQLACTNGYGTIGNGPGQAKSIKCSGRTGTISFTVGHVSGGTMKMICDGSEETLTCGAN